MGPPKRKLSPQSVWDPEAVTQAWQAVGVNAGHHLTRLYQ